MPVPREKVDPQQDSGAKGALLESPDKGVSQLMLARQ